MAWDLADQRLHHTKENYSCCGILGMWNRCASGICSAAEARQEKNEALNSRKHILRLAAQVNVAGLPRTSVHLCPEHAEVQRKYSTNTSCPNELLVNESMQDVIRRRLYLLHTLVQTHMEHHEGPFRPKTKTPPACQPSRHSPAFPSFHEKPTNEARLLGHYDNTISYRTKI